VFVVRCVKTKGCLFSI